MTDYITWAVMLFAAAGLIILAILIDRMRAWHIIAELIGKKAVMQKDVGQREPPKDTTIVIEHPTKGSFNYYGRNPKPDGKFGLLDMGGHEFMVLSWNQLRLINVEPVFEGKTHKLRFLIEDDSLYDRYERLIKLKDAEVQKMIAHQTSLAKAQNEIEVQHAANRRATWDKEFRGRRVFYDNKKGGRPQQSEGPPPDEGGGGE